MASRHSPSKQNDEQYQLHQVMKRIDRFDDKMNQVNQKGQDTVTKNHLRI